VDPVGPSALWNLADLWDRVDLLGQRSRPVPIPHGGLSGQWALAYRVHPADPVDRFEI